MVFSPREEEQSNGARKRWMILGLVSIALVIVASSVSIGWVIGRKGRSSSSSTDKATPIDADAPTTEAFTDSPTMNPTSNNETLFEDPFNNANPEDTNLWRTNRSGLRLTIINALEEKWHSNFYKAVNEWDSGTPDALSLITEVSRPDAVCRGVNGRVKFCNGNYKATKWRGINKVLLDNGWIYSSAARMNDYYVTDSDVAQKQYSMCHEMGHAFGLPHTDEDFYNQDLFNCMDYTTNPENNMQPAEPNFQFLALLYGTIDGAIQPRTAAVSTQNVGPEDNNDRNVRSLVTKELPPAIELALDDIDAIVDSGEISNTKRNGWRRLHVSEHGETHEIDLGNGFIVQLHILGA